ncbi:phospholipase [Microbacterium paraoxydans]|uniref:Phospholipase n=1 Tax=Microbacterium paraoxydans TaxID=199592 RepID=A0ABS5IS25_9MICO|nr:phospholipase [Microbacterium paraoxydans]MBS0025536.1 phospholipase [Microbacterium paraoxydans]
MLQKTRALRRASEVAAARAAVTRTPLLVLGTAAAALVGITLTVGVTAAPAAGAAHPDASSAITSQAFGAEPLTRIADEAVTTVSKAQDAVAAADALTTEVTASGLDVSAAAPVDTTQLKNDLETLDDRATLPLLLVTVATEQAATETEKVVAETAALQQAYTAAQEQKAAEEAARVAAEQAAAAAAALAAANTVDGAKATAQQMMADRYGWGGDQFSCLNSLWTKESGWNYQAYNSNGGATGIPQALPGSKMASAGADWQTNAATQIAWGLKYIADAYGTPCSAWGHSQAMNWY